MKNKKVLPNVFAVSNFKLSNWFDYYNGINSSLFLEKYGYYDDNPILHTSVTQLLMIVLMPVLCCYSFLFLLLMPLCFFGYGKLFVRLPINTNGLAVDAPRWGVDFHNDTFWLYVGKSKVITWDLPFFTFEWIRTSVLLNDETWEHDTKSHKKNLYDDFWEDKKKYYIYSFTDYYDGEVIPVKFFVLEREHRPKWLNWTTIFSKKTRMIEIDFSKPVGKDKKDNWKGGLVGCSYEMKQNENPMDCIIRFEKEYKA